MLANIDVNATVYVQPTSRDLVDSRGFRSWRSDDAGSAAAVKQLAVGSWRSARFCGLACVFVSPVIARGLGKPRESKLDERGNHGLGTIRDTMPVQYGAYFLLQLPDRHRFAFEIRDQLAERLRRRAKAELTQQLI